MAGTPVLAVSSEKRREAVKSSFSVSVITSCGAPEASASSVAHRLSRCLLVSTNKKRAFWDTIAWRPGP